MLNPPQQDVVDSGYLTSGFSAVLQMATGAGKTHLAQHEIRRTLDAGNRAVYLSPLKALAAELSARWANAMAPHAVGVFTGDFGAGKQAWPVDFNDARLLVMTPERLDVSTRGWRTHWSWLSELDLVVVDEIHLLNDRHRGARLEGALSRLRRLNPFARILGLSATLGNRGELADWLGGIEYHSAWRPIPLTWKIIRYKKADRKPPLLATEVGRNVQQGGKSLVFVQSRRRAEELARKLADGGIRSTHHHAGLDYTTRNRIEQQYRTGEIDVLVATSTLSQGLNFPCRQVVLYDLQQWTGADFQALPVNEVWQRVGRAGRPGLDPSGEAILFAATWDRQAREYEAGHYEPIRSALSDDRMLAEQTIAEVASGLSRTRTQLHTAFRTSLAHHQSILTPPRVERTLDTMLQAELLREARPDDRPEGPLRLFATRLGRIAARHLLLPETVLTFRRAVETESDLTFFDLLLVACATQDAEPVLPVDYEELDSLASLLASEPSHLLAQGPDRIAAITGTAGKRLLAAIKMALALRGWTRSGDQEGVATQLDCYPFEIMRLRESAGRLLLAFQAVARPEGNSEENPIDDFVPVHERLSALMRMVAAGLDAPAATLTLVPGIGPKHAARLVSLGIMDIEDLANTEPGEIAGERLASARALQWVEAASDLLRSRSPFRYREIGGTRVQASGWPTDIDPYRLRRALDLVTVREGDQYLVSGGLEPHRLHRASDSLRCDCVDSAKGHTCKHILAVRLYEDDPTLQSLAHRLTHQEDRDGLDLFTLWTGR